MMNWFKSKRIFLDYASATPLRREVGEVMRPYEEKDFYNPSAIYAEGQKVGRDLQKFREAVARTFDATSGGIIFTSSGTASNLLALQGLPPGHVVISEDSHPSVAESAKGREYSIWKNGEEIPLRPDTVLVSTVESDNKLGRQIREVRKKTSSPFPLLHIDATQTVQYHRVSLESSACDLITVDASKLYGPKGVAALIVRKGVTLDLPPSGTPPLSLIAGFTKALELAVRDRESEAKRLNLLTQKFVGELKRVPKLEVSVRPPNTVLVSLPGILPELLVLALEKEGILVSAGPACNANKPEPHGIHVMDSVPVRLSLGRGTTEKELEIAVKKLCLIVENMVK